MFRVGDTLITRVVSRDTYKVFGLKIETESEYNGMNDMNDEISDYMYVLFGSVSVTESEKIEPQEHPSLRSPWASA